MKRPRSCLVRCTMHPLILGLAGWLAIPAALFSQTKESVELPTPAPRRMLMPPGGFFAAARFCLIHGAPLYQSNTEDSKVIGRLNYMEEVNLADGYPEKSDVEKSKQYRLNRNARKENTDWALVCTPDPNSESEIGAVRGWVPRRFLSDELRAERDPVTQVLKKAVIVTKTANNMPVQVGSVQPLLAPGDPDLRHVDWSGLPSLEPPPKLQLYRMFFVYAEYGDWVLISPDPVQTSANIEELQADVFGWIPAHRVARWNTRECFEWIRETFPQRQLEPGKLFLNSEDALAYHQRGQLPKDELFLSEPDPHVRGRLVRLEKSAMRFHLLLGPEEAQERGLPNASDWNDQAGNRGKNRLFQIGAVISNGRINTRIESEQSIIESTAAEVADTEILFIIDDTGSMHIAFQVVADIVEQISAEVEKDQEEGDVRVGVCFYHDGDTPQAAVNVENAKLRSIRSGTELRRLILSLTQHKVIKDSENDPLERVYDGIHEGITAAGFKNHSRKLVILLGDCGEKKDEKGRVESLADLLVSPSKSPIEFHAIQLKDPATRKKTSYRVFQDQFKFQLRGAYEQKLKEELAEAFEDSNDPPDLAHLYSYTICDTPAVGEPNLKEITQTISDQVLKNVHVARLQGASLRRKLREFATTGKLEGEAKEDIAEAGIASLAILQRILKMEGLEDYGKNPQIYNTLYAWENNSRGQTQMRRMVLVDSGSLNTAILVLQDLEEKLQNQRGLAAENAIVKILSEQVGSSEEVPPELTDPRDKAIWLLNHLSFQSDLFRKILDPRKYGPPDLEDYAAVFLKRRLLEAIKAGKETAPDDYVERIPPGSSPRFKQWQFKDGDLKSKPVLQRGFPQFYQTRRNYEDDEANAGLLYYLDYEKEWP